MAKVKAKQITLWDGFTYELRNGQVYSQVMRGSKEMSLVVDPALIAEFHKQMGSTGEPEPLAYGTAFTIDQLGFLQIANAEILAAVARGELDLNACARHELAARGLDRSCKWVGFVKAKQLAQQLPVRGAGGKTIYVSVPEDDK